MAIFAALQWECRPVLQQLRRVTRDRVAHATVWRGYAGACEVWLVKTGIGIQHAEVAAQAVCATQPFNLVMSTGCAGGLAPTLAPGDVTLADAIVCESGNRFATDDLLRETMLRAAERAALRTTVGPVLCSAQALATVAAKRAAAARGAVAVEMEGVPIATCAARTGIPFVSVRAILDTADTELRTGGKFIHAQSGTVKPLALAGYLATHPRALPELVALQRMMRAAQISLERFFVAWLPTLDS